MLKSYKELKVWQKAYRLCLYLYQITNKFPKFEKYCLTPQIKRAAISIPSNIAEGYGGDSIKEYIHFLYIAYSSICELETQILLSFDLGYIEEEQKDDFILKLKEVERMLKALINSLEVKKLEPLKPRNPETSVEEIC